MLVFMLTDRQCVIVMLLDVPACFVDCLSYDDFCAESDCYADCSSCQQTFVDEVLCGSFSYSYACDSYSFDMSMSFAESMSYSLGSDDGSYAFKKSYDFGSYGSFGYASNSYGMHFRFVFFKLSYLCECSC